MSMPLSCWKFEASGFRIGYWYCRSHTATANCMNIVIHSMEIQLQYKRILSTVHITRTEWANKNFIGIKFNQFRHFCFSFLDEVNRWKLYNNQKHLDTAKTTPNTAASAPSAPFCIIISQNERHDIQGERKKEREHVALFRAAICLVFFMLSARSDLKGYWNRLLKEPKTGQIELSFNFANGTM